MQKGKPTVRQISEFGKKDEEIKKTVYPADSIRSTVYGHPSASYIARYRSRTQPPLPSPGGRRQKSLIFDG